MKASTEVVVPEERAINLQLTEREATILVSFLGGSCLDLDKEAGQTIYELFTGLSAQLPGRTLSFSDFFKGEIEVK